MATHLLAATFRHGVHPDEHKEATAHLPLVRMPFVERYVLPLAQNLGRPPEAVVRVGQSVERGQLIAAAAGFVSADLHSPVTGKVTAVAPRRHPNGQLVQSIEIEADVYATQRAPSRAAVAWQELSTDGFVQLIKEGGLVGMGGAAFPSHVKYSLPEGKTCEHLVINGCECEPYLTCDHRTMVEQPEAVIRGIEMTVAKLGAKGATIGVEWNKPDAIEALRSVIRPDQKIEVVGLRVKYPQGAEKMLINSIFGREVPAGKLPLDIGYVVNNVGTMAALGRWVDHGMPLIERAVTVSGPGVRRPANLIIPIGTPVREVLDYCGGLLPGTTAVVMGGPMMGQPLSSLDGPVLKGTSGILAFTPKEAGPKVEYSCVRCGRCLESCANFLNPSRLARLGKAGMLEEMQAYNINDCMECGACTFACPSGIPIVQLIRSAKAALRSQKK